MSSTENQIPPPQMAAQSSPPPPPTAELPFPPPVSADAENIQPPRSPPSLEELSRRGVRSLFLPHILNLISSSSSPPAHPREILVLVNFRTGAMTMVEGSGSGGIEELLREKEGPSPASKASIEAMRSVEVKGEEGFECSICLDGEGGLELVKEMPCKHLFHSGCIQKWLGIHGSCPVCRFQMPVEGEGMGIKNGGDEDGDDVTRGSEDGDGGGGEGRAGFVFHIYVTGSLRRESGSGLDTGTGAGLDTNHHNENEGGGRSVDPNENLGSMSDIDSWN